MGVLMDVICGEFHGATYAKTPMGHFPVVAGEPARVAAASHTGKVFVDTPQLVWKFCNESTKPWDPFYLLTATDGTVAYVRHDGTFLDKLTAHNCVGGR